MSINGRQFRSKTAQRRANAEYFTASMGGSVDDWMDKSKPRHRIYDGMWLEQKGYKFAKAYDYTVPKSESRKKEELLYQVCRYEHTVLSRHKLFAMRRPTGDYLVDEWFADAGEIKIIYRWPEVAASKPSEVIYVTEGERIATASIKRAWSRPPSPVNTGRKPLLRR